jgi:hypothetical protein
VRHRVLSLHRTLGRRGGGRGRHRSQAGRRRVGGTGDALPPRTRCRQGGRRHDRSRGSRDLHHCRDDDGSSLRLGRIRLFLHLAAAGGQRKFVRWRTSCLMEGSTWPRVSERRLSASTTDQGRSDRKCSEPLSLSLSLSLS